MNTHKMNATLSAKELFEHRSKNKGNQQIPQRGEKEFEPDGSWLQDKRLTAFYEEYQSVLAEPRVQKSGNLVEGFWDAKHNLVNLKNYAKKFFMKMGFVEEDRTWLFPEEGLYLMEVNDLELFHGGVSLSLQEAYPLLLDQAGGVTGEEYQVYAHLRRLGYTVLRHQGKLEIPTDYECKIGIDKIKQKHRKKKKHLKSEPSKIELDSEAVKHSELKRAIGSCGESSSESNLYHISSQMRDSASSFSEKMDTNCYSQKSVENKTRNITESQAPSKDSSQQQSNKLLKETITDSHEESATLTNKGTPSRQAMKRTKSKEKTEREPSVKRKKEEEIEGFEKKGDNPTLPMDEWSLVVRQSLSQESNLNVSTWDFAAIRFPDIGGKDMETLDIPPAHLLPSNTGISEEYEDMCMFDVEAYREQQNRHSFNDRDLDYGHLKSFEFSYAEYSKRHSKPVRASNWREWKALTRERDASGNVSNPCAHLWQGEVTPLVRPEDATSTYALLNKLSVIEEFQWQCPEDFKGKMKISFDVYLPKTQTVFRKSSPGLPNHRICVSKDSHPPSLKEIQEVTAHLCDGVPLHWAVVSSGELSFTVFDSHHLPVHPSSLG